MHSITFKLINEHYACSKASNIGMDILGYFLASDVRCMNINFYKKWALDDNQDVTGGNITYVEKEKSHVYLSDLYSEETIPTKFRMTTEQFIQLLDDWEIKVCKARPQEVIMMYDNDQFTIEMPH